MKKQQKRELFSKDYVYNQTANLTITTLFLESLIGLQLNIARGRIEEKKFAMWPIMSGCATAGIEYPNIILCYYDIKTKKVIKAEAGDKKQLKD